MFPPHAEVPANLASTYSIKLASPGLVTATKLKDLEPQLGPREEVQVGDGGGEIISPEVQGQLPELGLPSASELGCPGASQGPS